MGSSQPGGGQPDPPPLRHNASFWGLTLTQFLGAFNDNLFKQLVLLVCTDHIVQGSVDRYQTTAAALFAFPFVIFSGYAGYLSDRYPKRRVIVACKVAEIALMVIGVVSFAAGSLVGLFVVLALMGTHSAFFGPSKYGILPELLQPKDLPSANGIILMTTFLSIILGFSTAGAVKYCAGPHVWLACCFCIGIAMLGTLTATWIRWLPAANPTLVLRTSSLFVDRELRTVLKTDRSLLWVLLASSSFWLVGGMVYPPTINSVAKLQLRLDDLLTGMMAASTGVGIAVGCLLAGFLSRSLPRPILVRIGSAGLCTTLILLGVPGTALGGTLLGAWGMVGGLVLVGLFAGLYSVPLQVYLQLHAPKELKGRMIAALNFLNWVAILASAGCYGLADWLTQSLGLQRAAIFAIAGLLFLPVALCYRLPQPHPDERDPAATDTVIASA